MTRRKTADAARGHWKGILMALGVEDRFLQNKHGPCPMCGGRDRYRWDNKDGNGGYICGQCGSGNGFDLLKHLRGWDFATAAREIDGVIGNVEADPPKRKMSEEAEKELCNRLWQASTPLVSGDPAHVYLAGRVPLPQTMPNCLRYVDRCPAPDKVFRPAMLAMVRATEGEPQTIHRTFLGPNGKADMEDPRAMMPGALPDGCAVRLFPVHGERLGIAEGIETAFAAAARFKVPVWSAINATMLEKWLPPATVREVWVFGDNDPKFGGQAAAYKLSAKLAGRFGLAVRVEIPPTIGTDWADIEPQLEPTG